MYAVIETGGKQYRVSPGDVIDIERTATSGKKVRKVKFDRVLLIADDKGVRVGSPVVKGANVSGVALDDVRGEKVRVFKMKRRKGYRRHQGHRQNYLRVRIEGIELGAAKKKAKKKSTED